MPPARLRRSETRGDYRRSFWETISEVLSHLFLCPTLNIFMLKGMVTTSSGSMADAVLSQGRSTVQHRVCGAPTRYPVWEDDMHRLLEPSTCPDVCV